MGKHAKQGEYQKCNPCAPYITFAWSSVVPTATSAYRFLPRTTATLAALTATPGGKPPTEATILQENYNNWKYNALKKRKLKLIRK